MMFVTLNDTPEHIRRKREQEAGGRKSLDEEEAVLTLAPFTKPPSVVFKDVPIGTTAERTLLIHNPTKKTLVLSVDGEPPAGLQLSLGERSVRLQPGDRVQVGLRWRPAQPAAISHTLYLQDEARRRYAVTLVLKSALPKPAAKSKGKVTKAKRKSPVKQVINEKISPRLKSKEILKPEYLEKYTHLREYKSVEKFTNTFNIEDETTSIPVYRQQIEFDYSAIPLQGDYFNKPSRSDYYNVQSEPSYYKMPSKPQGYKLPAAFGKHMNMPPEFNEYMMRLQADQYDTPVMTKKKTKQSNKENLSPNMLSVSPSCPFKSPVSTDSFTSCVDFSGMFPHISKGSYHKVNCDEKESALEQNITQEDDLSMLVDNLAFTPLKTNRPKHDALIANLAFSPLKCVDSATNKLNEVRKIDFPVEPNTRDYYVVKQHKIAEEMNMLITPKSPEIQQHPPIFRVPWNSVHEPRMSQVETGVQNKKIGNTSSPKHHDFSSINFSLNTDFSRISSNDFSTFYPPRCSTERKQTYCKNDFPSTIDQMDKIDAVTPGMAVITPSEPKQPEELGIPALGHIKRQLTYEDTRNVDNKLQAEKPYHYEQQNPVVTSLGKRKQYLEVPSYNYKKEKSSLEAINDPTFDHRKTKESFIQPQVPRQRKVDRNNSAGIKSVLETQPWSFDSPSSRPMSPLQSIPEESIQQSESRSLDKTDKSARTFTINRTFEKTFDKTFEKTFDKPQKTAWTKKSVRCELDLWKVGADRQQNESERYSMYSNSIGNVYTQSSTADPFLSQCYFYDEEAVQQFENEFKRWLNYILTPPSDLESNTDGQSVDVGKLWLQNRTKEIPAAPTKEQVCSKYHDSYRLGSLRKAARELLNTQQMKDVYMKLYAQIEKKLIAMRPDKNLLMDVGLQKIILSIIFCYNPLWLRIGLEAIYGVVIPLTANSDYYGLSVFIEQRLFKDPHWKPRGSQQTMHNMLNPAYLDYMNKFTLKKYFTLVYFLDQAKQKKLIPHDPCLFSRTAQYKESREMLIRFTRECITGVGDICKQLRPIGYVVTTKQSYIDEFKYAVHNLAIDLKDGVRLTKVMEVILCRAGLVSGLRTPAVSRLQKIHNVQIALNALKEANFNIVGDITAKDIADGHREKTLSLLWQIIHVFKAPLFEKAANVIQMWWKKKYFKIYIEKRIECRKFEKITTAANNIQIWYRRILYSRKLIQVRNLYVEYCNDTRKKIVAVNKIKSVMKRNVIINKFRRTVLAAIEYNNKRNVEERAAVLIQKTYKGWQARRQYQMAREKMIKIQSLIRKFVAKRRYENLKKSTLCIQRRFRAHRSMKTQKQMFDKVRHSVVLMQSRYKMIVTRRQYLKLKWAVSVVETRYIAQKQMKRTLLEYTNYKKAVIKIQSLIKGHISRKKFLKKKNAAIAVQRRFRANMLRNKVAYDYLKLRKSVIIVQRRFRAKISMRHQREKYLALKKSAITIQRMYRACKVSKKCREEYGRVKSTVIMLQRRYRAKLLGRSTKAIYIEQKRAIDKIKIWYRSAKLMQKDKTEYRRVRDAALTVQRYYRNWRMGQKTRKDYVQARNAAIVLQRRYRALQQQRDQRKQYIKIRESVVIIQRWYRSRKEIERCRSCLLNMKQDKLRCNSATKIQNWYRTSMQARKMHNDYLLMKESAIKIQSFYRMHVERQRYLTIKKIITIQRKYKAKLLGRKARADFVKQKKAANKINTWYKSTKLMQKDNSEYIKIRTAIIKIQRCFKNWKLGQNIQKDYIKLRNAAITIQRRFRARKLQQTQRNEYNKIRVSVVTIQKWYRARKCIERCRLCLQTLKSEKLQIVSATKIQSWYRSTLLTRKLRHEYLLLRNSVIKIQSVYRMYVERQRYLMVKKIISMQRKYRAKLLGRSVRAEYAKQKHAIHMIKVWYNSTKLMQKYKSEYRRLRSATIKIQRYFRNWKLSQNIRKDYVKMRNAALTLQRRYRAWKLQQIKREEYKKIRDSVVTIQKWYRTRKEIERCRLCLKNMKLEKQRNDAAAKIQYWYRACVQTRQMRSGYLALKTSTITIQAVYRMYIERKRYSKIKNSAIAIQTHYRSFRLMCEQKNIYMRIRNAAIKIQAYVRRWFARKKYLKIYHSIIIIQKTYRVSRNRRMLLERLQKRRKAAVCLQKYARMCLQMRKYKSNLERIKFIQQRWRSILLTRQFRQQYLTVRDNIIRIQALVRGYVLRKKLEKERAALEEMREKRKKEAAATIIQSWARGHLVRCGAGAGAGQAASVTSAAAAWRQRWRSHGARSTQETLRARHEDALHTLFTMRDMAAMLRAFISLDLLTEVFPETYIERGALVAECLVRWVISTNRSVASIEALRLAGAILVNLARFPHTAHHIYHRRHVSDALRFLIRWCSIDSQLLCVFLTYLWLFHKYPHCYQDLSEFLQESENSKYLHRIRTEVYRRRRMADNLSRSRAGGSAGGAGGSTGCRGRRAQPPLPMLEPDHGYRTPHQPPKYFESDVHAIDTLFQVYQVK